MERFLAVLRARNLEFFRDRSALVWNLVFPVLLVAGFAFAFSGPERALYKVGTLQAAAADPAGRAFLATRHLDFVAYAERERALEQLRRHQLALLVEFAPTPRYWVNADAPAGYVVERLLRAAGADYPKETVQGRAIRYVDWVLPGVLGMNLMFSSLFGVGYTIVRYRKNGVLKRLKATPLSAFEFLAAQVVSRLAILLAVSSFLLTSCSLLIDFPMHGSYLDLLLIAFVGCFCLISLGLLVASRTASEEWAGGVLNFCSWPMLFLSGVWFSLEGSPQLMQWAAQLLPLTHLIDAARSIMLDGATLLEVAPQLAALTGMSLLFLAAGARLFRWDID